MIRPTRKICDVSCRSRCMSRWGHYRCRDTVENYKCDKYTSTRTRYVQALHAGVYLGWFKFNSNMKLASEVLHKIVHWFTCAFYARLLMLRRRFLYMKRNIGLNKSVTCQWNGRLIAPLPPAYPQQILSAGMSNISKRRPWYQNGRLALDYLRVICA